ncbi:MAG: class I SAM-dependent methyltransferase family protein [Candidatus Methanoplasma sp.]|jgi:tRNA (guanine37-N1)-methyltransferase|nr:class I SAM-dependent methyltransferase family protein [Candidatus Methanoplasma sp.]
MARCVRVSKRDGEYIRALLIDTGFLDPDHKIKADGDSLLLPVLRDVDGFETLEADLEVQAHAITDYREFVNIPDVLKGELPNSYDVIGDVAIIKFDPNHPNKHEIGEALLRVTPSLRTVMLDAGVKGEFRIRDLVQIAGTGGSETIHKEFGVRMIVDPAKVYFNPRLATERSRVAGEVKDGEVIIDMFAGVAPFGLVISKHAKPEIIYSIDLNPDAAGFMQRNIEANHVTNIVPITGNAATAVNDLPEADRIIMNLPHMADLFLPHALKKLKTGGIIHLHKIVERSETEWFAKKFIADSELSGYKIHIARSAELKTYSPTMSVYVFDIVKD